MVDTQTSKMIKMGDTSTAVGKQKIFEAVKSFNFTADTNSQNFGISMDDRLLQFEGIISYLKTNLYIFIKVFSCRTCFTDSEIGLRGEREQSDDPKGRHLEYKESPLH